MWTPLLLGAVFIVALARFFRDQSGRNGRIVGLVFALLVFLVIRRAPGLFGSSQASSLRHLTKAELWTYRGQESDRPIYLAIHGKIYDVSAGRDHYGPGGGYAGFAGRDASRAFVDLCFTDECLEVADQIDTWDTTEENIKAVKHWENFYATEKKPDGSPKYPFIGYVVKE